MTFKFFFSYKFKITAALCLLISVFSCERKSALQKEIQAVPMEVKVERFDQAFMKIKAEHLPYLKMPYPFLFPKQTPDSVFLKRTQDPIQKLIQASVDSVFANFESTELDLRSFYKHIKYYNPSLKKPRLITVYSDVDYRNKVIVTDSIVLIGIDNYLGATHEFYDGFYSYIKKRNTRHIIVTKY